MVELSKYDKLAMVGWAFVIGVMVLSWSFIGEAVNPIGGFDPSRFVLERTWLQWSHIGFAIGLLWFIILYLPILWQLTKISIPYTLWGIFSLVLLAISLSFYAIYAPLVITNFDQIGWFGFKLGEPGIVIWFERQPLVWVWLLWGLTLLNTLFLIPVSSSKIKSESLEAEEGMES